VSDAVLEHHPARIDDRHLERDGQRALRHQVADSHGGLLSLST
jgi:hypothetical protein